jgi:hypothetical protein
MIVFLFSSKPHRVALVSGGSFGQRSFANQIRTLLTAARWDIALDMHVFPSNPNALVIQGRAADDMAVLTLQHLFDIAGIKTRFEPKGKTEMAQAEVILNLP